MSVSIAGRVLPKKFKNIFYVAHRDIITKVYWRSTIKSIYRNSEIIIKFLARKRVSPTPISSN